MLSKVLVNDHPVGAEPVNRIAGHTTGPQDIGRTEHEGKGISDDAARPEPRRWVDSATTRNTQRRISGSEKSVHRDFFEALQEFGDGFVDALDAGNRHRPGDDADLIGAITLVMGLPQRIRTPPTAHVAIEHGDEVDRLARSAAEVDEERNIGRVDDDAFGVGVSIHKSPNRFRPIVDRGRIGEQRRDLTAVGVVQTRFGLLDHAVEAVALGHVEPHLPAREFNKAFEPCGVRHGLDITEVGLGRGVECGDDLVTAFGNRVGIAGDLVEKSTATRSGVVDFVDVGAKLTETGGHAARSGARTYPIGGAGCVDQQLFHRGSSRGFECRHSGGADEDAVERHRRVAELLRPAAVEITGGDFGSADAATDTQDDIFALAQVAVGGDEEFVEVLPGVVSAGLAAFDLDDDRRRGNFLGDLDDRLDLLEGARLQDDVTDVGVAEFGDEGNCVIEFGHSGRDNHAIDGGTGGAGALNQSLVTDLEFPEVRVEEQRVELECTARIEEFAHFGDAIGKDLLSHLTAAGEFGPEAGIGGSCDDFGVDRRGRHTGEQDRRAAGELGETGLDVETAVGQGNDLGCVSGPRLLGAGSGTGACQFTVTSTGRGRDDHGSASAKFLG